MHVLLAEGEGFEPPVSCPTTVFKTAALNRSANPPRKVGLIRVDTEWLAAFSA